MKTDGLQTKQKVRKQSSGLGLVKRLIILALIPALIMGGFMSIFLFKKLDSKKQADQIRSIADYMVATNQVVHQLQKEHSASAGYIASNGNSMSDMMEKQRHLTDKYYTVLEKNIKLLDMGKLGNKFARQLDTLSKNLWELPSIREKVKLLSIENNESNEFYFKMIKDIIGTFQEASIMVKNSELSLQFTAFINFTMAKEMVAVERVLMMGFVAEDKPVTQIDMHKWMQVSNGQDTLFAAFEYQMTEDILKEFRTKLSEANIKDVIDIRMQISKNLKKGKFGLKPEYVFAATTRRIDDLKKAEDAQLQKILKNTTKLSAEKMVSVIIYSGMVGGSAVAMFILFFLITRSIAVVLNTVKSRDRTNELLEQTQQQAEELQTLEEELRQSNKEHEENARALKESESRLQVQQEELRRTNEELEEQKEDVERKNKELEDARKIIEERAQDLELSSKYKSEFLANMSHELRTPLNSILLLSKLLADNKDGSMSEDKVESVQSIYSSGNDLLELINDILDLSKVEVGMMELLIDNMYLRDFCNSMKRIFQPIANESNINLNVDISEGLPDYILTDEQRVEQIVKNFLSNAFKFTSEGSVSLYIGRPNESSDNVTDLSKSELDPNETISISIIDTGIGIPEEQQEIIFDAFQQADGTTSRKYGGTGLGLSISKELAKLLKGKIHMKSTYGKGSTFTLYLPETLESEPETKETFSVPSPVKQGAETVFNKQSEIQTNLKKIEITIKDDRKTISADDQSILIIEDDPKFLKILRDLTREHGFKCLVAGNGKTGLQFADYYKPSGIIMDVSLPGISGWSVMTRLKDNPETRHIPVHFISASDNKIDAKKMGAIDYLTKPVSLEAIDQVFDKLNKVISKPVKDLLVVEDNSDHAKLVSEIVGSGDVRTTIALTATEAYNHVLSGKFDCIVLDISLPDMSGVDLLSKIRNNENISQLPVIVYTGRELTKQEKKIIDEYAESTIVKGEGSHRKLLDETTLFLHRVEANLPEMQQKILRMIHDKEKVLAGKKILVVDDDMRNVFSIKKILEDKGMKVLVGKNGKEGLASLGNNPDANLVLMDIMMPEMDGYTAIGEIRKQDRFKDLPIIALTAKAMKGDRAKCIEAGANDYLAKPFDIDRLFSMLRVWLY